MIVGLVLIRVRREDLAGVNPMAAPSDSVVAEAEAIVRTVEVD